MKPKTKIKSCELSWIVVKDFEAAIKFYTEVVGLKLLEKNDQFSWAELVGHEGGMRIGIAGLSPMDPQAGNNAVICLNVTNIADAHKDLEAQGVKFEEKMIEIPGQVKMWTFFDKDGNKMQLVEMLH